MNIAQALFSVSAYCIYLQTVEFSRLLWCFYDCGPNPLLESCLARIPDLMLWNQMLTDLFFVVIELAVPKNIMPALFKAQHFWKCTVYSIFLGYFVSVEKLWLQNSFWQHKKYTAVCFILCFYKVKKIFLKWSLVGYSYIVSVTFFITWVFEI